MCISSRMYFSKCTLILEDTDKPEIFSALFNLLHIHLSSNFPGSLGVRMREKNKKEYFSILSYLVKYSIV